MTTHLSVRVVGAKLAELSAHGAEINEEAAFADQLQKYDTFTTAIKESISQQENLLNGIRVCTRNYVEKQGSGRSSLSFTRDCRQQTQDLQSQSKRMR